MEKLNEFMSPRLVGDRFNNHAIPFEVLKDLAVLEELVIETAKWQYLQQKQDRQRVPRGFAEGISLQLSDVKDGSAIPTIMLLIETTLVPLPSTDNIQFFLDARTKIIDAVSAAEEQRSITSYLPEHLLNYFDRIGRSLRDGEALELEPSNFEHPARLNKETRKRILLASSRVQELSEEIALRGTVPEMDQEKNTFEFQVISGPKVKAPIVPQHRDAILEAFNGYRDGKKVFVSGIGRLNRSDKLQSIESVEHISLLDPDDMAARLDEFRGLKQGWLNGKGNTLSTVGLDWLTRQFEINYPESLNSPYLYPTAEGGVQAEWSIDKEEISLEINLQRHVAEWHQLNMQDTTKEVYRELNLENPSDWAWIVEQIQEVTNT